MISVVIFSDVTIDMNFDNIGIIKKVNGELTDMNTLYSFASTAIRKKCKTLQKKIQISFCTEINTNLVKRH